jgi:hypothetical protein
MDDAHGATGRGRTCHPARREIVFIDRGVAHGRVLFDGVPPAVGVAWIEPGRPALAQIAGRLADGPPVGGLHIVGHGEPAALLLAGERIDGRTLVARPSALAGIARALAADARVMLYSCSVAAGSLGRAFVAVLETGLGAVVAASDGPVGAAARGGTWLLRNRDGVPVEPVFTSAARAAFPELLGPRRLIG